MLSAARALKDSNMPAVPRPAVSIPSLPLPTSEQHVTIIQVLGQQWDALIKRFTTLEDQVARLSERIASSNTKSVPNKHNEPSNRQASLCALPGKERPQTTAMHQLPLCLLGYSKVPAMLLRPHLRVGPGLKSQEVATTHL